MAGFINLNDFCNFFKRFWIQNFGTSPPQKSSEKSFWENISTGSLVKKFPWCTTSRLEKLVAMKIATNYRWYGSLEYFLKRFYSQVVSKELRIPAAMAGKLGSTTVTLDTTVNWQKIGQGAVNGQQNNCMHEKDSEIFLLLSCLLAMLTLQLCYFSPQWKVHFFRACQRNS